MAARIWQFATVLIMLSPSDAWAGFQSYEDYPQSAVDNNEHGTAVANLRIGADGKIESCEIVRSSTSSTLDAATCAGLMHKAKFNPAIDRAGQAIAANHRMAVHWILPDVEATAADLPIRGADLRIIYIAKLRAQHPSISSTEKPTALRRIANRLGEGLKYSGEALRIEKEGETTAAVSVDAQGKIVGCTIVRSVGVESLDSQWCPHILAHVSYLPEVNFAGEKVASIDIATMRWRIGSKSKIIVHLPKDQIKVDP